MKNKIEGIEKGKIIRSINKVGKKSNGYILVNYLDGTQDAIECTEENLNAITELMNSQAREYIKGEKKVIKKHKYLQGIILIVMGICVIPSSIYSIIISSIPILTTAVACALAGLVSLKISNDRVQDMKKYSLFISSINSKLDEYKNILDKENKLTNGKKNSNTKLNDITGLDRVSLKELEDISTKVDRYSEIEGKQKIKVKENTSEY